MSRKKQFLTMKNRKKLEAGSWKDEELFKSQKENIYATFKELRNIMSEYKVRKLREYMREVSYWDLKIVDSHGAVNPQKETYWFKQVYVSLSCGYTGDNYSGTTWIPLPNGKYLEYLFCC